MQSIKIQYEINLISMIKKNKKYYFLNLLNGLEKTDNNIINNINIGLPVAYCDSAIPL